MQDDVSGLIPVMKTTGDRGVVANVVFVHGLGGHAYETWQHDTKDRKSFWPNWLFEDLNASHEGTARPVGVWSLGYPAAVFEGLFFGKARDDSIPQRARDLVDLVVGCGLADRPIIFVTHSLGGILVKQMLRSSSDAGDPRINDFAKVALSTRLVMFLATPHSGSTLANVAAELPQVRGMAAGGVASAIDWLPVAPLARIVARRMIRPGRLLEALRKGDPYLEDLGMWYRNNAHRIGITTRSYCENAKLGITTVVDKLSANPGVSGSEMIPIDADHSSICKPLSRNEHYQRMANPIKQAVWQCPVFKETHLAVLDVGERFARLGQVQSADRMSATKKVVQPIELRLGRDRVANPVDYMESASGKGEFRVAAWQEALAATSPYDLDRVILNVWHQYTGGIQASDPTRAVRLELERLKVDMADQAGLTLIPLHYAARALRVQRDRGNVQLGDADKDCLQSSLALVENLAACHGMDAERSTRKVLKAVLGLPLS